jgi:NAD(P)-dependent dehydrogenase (short-subunit alcohol dehydrogenase family)
MGRLEGKVVLITGVGSGIGQAAAQLFCKAGATVFGVDRDPGEFTAIASSRRDRFQFFQADLSQEQNCIQVVWACKQRFERLDILYNNGGRSIVALFAQTSTAALAEIVAVNFQSVY